MIILGFCSKTSKVLPRLICKKFRHVAVIDVRANALIMYQFVRRGQIVKLKLGRRDIKILGQYGWVFVQVKCALPRGFDMRQAWTCVGLAKYAVGICDWRIQTPDGLYQTLRKYNLLKKYNKHVIIDMT